MKQISIEKIRDIAKACLEKTKQYRPQLMLEIGDRIEIMVLGWEDATKEKMMDSLREYIQSKNIQRYFMIMEAWMSKVDKGESPYIRATNSKNREEILVINEFCKDGNNKQIIIPFYRENDNIKFGEETCESKVASLWNFYLEKEGVDERFDNLVKNIDNSFIEKQAKILSNKFRHKFESGYDRNKLTEEIIEEMNKIKRKVDEKRIEDGNKI